VRLFAAILVDADATGDGAAMRSPVLTADEDAGPMGGRGALRASG